MKIPKIFQKKKYHAATSVRRAEPEFAEEPNIKLSSAVVVVLVLHLVAVGGIYAFNSLKVHQTPDATEVSSPARAESEDQEKSTVTAAANISRVHLVRSGETLAKIAGTNGVSVDDLEEANGLKKVSVLRVGQEIKIPAKPAGKPVASDSRKLSDTRSSAGAVKDSGDTYTVAKGDNPLLIAKKMHVAYDDLLKLNKIDDPKKLQIGQKLRLPAKH